MRGAGCVLRDAGNERFEVDGLRYSAHGSRRTVFCCKLPYNDCNYVILLDIQCIAEWFDVLGRILMCDRRDCL